MELNHRALDIAEGLYAIDAEVGNLFRGLRDGGDSEGGLEGASDFLRGLVDTEEVSDGGLHAGGAFVLGGYYVFRFASHATTSRSASSPPDICNTRLGSQLG